MRGADLQGPFVRVPWNANRPPGGRPGGRRVSHGRALGPVDQTAGAGYVGYSTPETCWTTRMTWQE